MKKTALLLCSLLWIAGFTPLPDTGPVSHAELISDVSAAAPGQSFFAALRITLKEGWHSYWQNPGDSGAPTTISWDAPEGVTAGPIHWPAPKRIPYGELMNFGYADEVLLLVPITINKDYKDTTITLTANADWLACADLCIPEHATLTLTLPVGDSAASSVHKRAIEEATRTVPTLYQGTITHQFSPTTLTFTLPGLESSITGATYFPFGSNVITHNAPQSFNADNNSLTLVRSPNQETRLDGLLVIDAADKTHYLQINQFTSAAAGAQDLSLPLALLLAVLGGVLLNLMPCVFPVLSLKALSLTKDAQTSNVHHQGIAYTAGVLVCFAGLAGLLLILKSGGEQIGWGFQMQSPVFVATMAYLFFTLGLSLSGYFNLPILAGNTLQHTGGIKGSFATGLFAALVATPCTAPFMGTAMGYAITQPAATALGIFLALGFGMALPYLLISFFPPLYRLLPKPGAWMNAFKHFMALSLFASAAWLIWVLAQQTTSHNLVVALGGFILIAAAIRLWNRLPKRNVFIGLLLLSVCLAPLYGVKPDGREPVLLKPKHAGVPYSGEALSSLRATQTPVLVNATAAWCITCLVNERLVLGTDAFQAELKAKGITYMVADWTMRDKAIADYLMSFQRSGVPLYVYYPKNGEPVILPQLLTEGIVEDYLK